MSDYTTPRDDGPLRALTGRGTSMGSASVISVAIRFGDPEFGQCRTCGASIARLDDRERWHHVDRAIGHFAEPMRVAS